LMLMQAAGLALLAVAEDRAQILAWCSASPWAIR
jgi:hypothetical protein